MNSITSVACALALTMFLTSCFSVDNFGSYWTKGFKDRHLVGTWKRSSLFPDPKSVGQLTEVIDKGDAYAIKIQDSKDKPFYRVRTLLIGPYTFLAAGPANGLLSRYKLKGESFKLCFEDPNSVADFVEARLISLKHPIGITVEHGMGSGILISDLNSDVQNILAHIPEGDNYWSCPIEYSKVR